MREQIERRLGELQGEYEAGQRVLADLEARQASVRKSLLRIGGAIQVLEELLDGGAAAAPADPDVGSVLRPGPPEDRAHGPADP